MIEKVKRVFLDGDPFAGNAEKSHACEAGYWPAKWLRFPGKTSPQSVLYFKREFILDIQSKILIHVTADERYRLFLDGEQISIGPSRGDNKNWYFKSYEIDLSAGKHIFVAQVWRLGDLAPFAQISGRNGFLFAAEEPFGQKLNTGIAPWQFKHGGGYTFRTNEIAWGPCFDTIVKGKEFDWGFEKGKGLNWTEGEKGDIARSGLCFADYSLPSNMLHPDPLPDMLYEELVVGKVRHVDNEVNDQTFTCQILAENNLPGEIVRWQEMISEGKPIAIASNQFFRVLIDLEDYYCAYPIVELNEGDGSEVRVSWAESLFEKPLYKHVGNPKGNRGEIEGKYFVAIGDEFYPDGNGERRFLPLWWRAGRYVELLIKTGAQPLTIKSFKFQETRYPLEMESEFVCNDGRINEIIPIMVRSIQMCSHETLMDCPYYEQQMYAGDTRLELLTQYCMTNDDRLARKALRMFGESLGSMGLTRSSYPSRVEQIIPPFSLWWIGMVHDYALWRGDENFVSSFKAKISCILNTFLNNFCGNKLLKCLNGWNFVDWVPSWDRGVPPQGEPGQISSIINLQLVLALEYAAQIEHWVGEKKLADYYELKAVNLLGKIVKNFFCSEENLLADDLAKNNFSEHAQVLAILSRNINQNLRELLSTSLLGRDDLAQATIYFNYYYFEACYKLRNYGAFFRRLKLWFTLKEKDFKTTFEEPGDSRSDCHGWGAHPLYHLFATLSGIRPVEFGFKRWERQPLNEENVKVSGKLNFRNGTIEL